MRKLNTDVPSRIQARVAAALTRPASFECDGCGEEQCVERWAVEAFANVGACGSSLPRAGKQRVPLLELPMPDPPPPGADWIEAYRRWSAQQRGA